MAGEHESSRTEGQRRTADLSWDNPDWAADEKPKRDWKKLLLIGGLGLLSWVATYVGMLELIEANMGDLPLIHKFIIGFSVGMLMLMVVWLLDQIFSDIGWVTRLLYVGGYVFLTVISVGFGFGFYWKVLESRSESSRSAESAVGQVQTSLHAAMTRLEQLQGTLDSLNQVSTQKAETERNIGTSCPNSKPGDGPRRKMRDDDAARFKFASDFVKGRVDGVRTELGALGTDLARITKDDKSIVDAKSGTRNDFMRELNRKLDMTVTGFNAFRTDPQLKQIRVDLNERADKVTFVDTKGGTYTCPDTQLTTALKGVVRAIDELPLLEKPKIAAVEGSEAVIEAFRRLTATFYGALSFKLPPSPEELRELQKKAVQSVENAAANQARFNAMAEQAGLSKRDYVPLAIALFVDLCLLLVSIGKSANRLDGLVPKMRAAERGPVIQILSRFNEIHRDKQIRENFEVFRHVVFDFHGDYYAAVPLNAPYRVNPRDGMQRQAYGVSDAQELLQEAHLLSNLFASFEKERIFTRVHSPLLGTKTIQKRLRRQGSKFASAEAFRVYRFRNGAWSEIILGAVMGAARRVEAEKRHRRTMGEPARDDRPEPTFAPPYPTNPTERFGADFAQVAINDRVMPATSPHLRQDGYGQDRPQPSDSAGSTRYAPYDEPAPRVHDIPREATAGTMVSPAATAPYAGLARTPSGMTGQATGTYHREAMDTAGAAPRPANSNTAPYMARAASRPEVALQPAHAMSAPDFGSNQPADNVVLHPAVLRPAAPSPDAPQMFSEASAEMIQPAQPNPAEPTMRVEAVRETITYSVPVSDATLPPHLLRPGQRLAPVTEAPASRTIALEPSRLPPPLPVDHPADQAAPASEENAPVIALPDVDAPMAVRAEKSNPHRAYTNGWQIQADDTLGNLPLDDTRSIALRLRPDMGAADGH